jgi:hypothetical protein
MSTRNIAGFGIEVLTGSSGFSSFDLSGLQPLITSATNLMMNVLQVVAFKIGSYSTGAIQMQDAFGTWFEGIRMFYHTDYWECVQMQAPASSAAVTVRKNGSRVDLDGGTTYINTPTTQIGTGSTNTTRIVGDLILDKGWTFGAIKAQAVGGSLWEMLKCAYIDVAKNVRVSLKEPTNNHGLEIDAGGNTIDGNSTVLGTLNVTNGLGVTGSMGNNGNLTSSGNLSISGIGTVSGAFLGLNTIKSINHITSKGTCFSSGMLISSPSSEIYFGRYDILATLPSAASHSGFNGTFTWERFLTLSSYTSLVDYTNILGITAICEVQRYDVEVGAQTTHYIRNNQIWQMSVNATGESSNAYFTVDLDVSKTILRLITLQRDSDQATLPPKVGSGDVRGAPVTITILFQKASF